MNQVKKLSPEINLRTKAWGLCVDQNKLTLTAVHNKLNQLSYKSTEILENYQNLNDEEVQDFIEEFQNRHKVKRGDSFMVLPRSEVEIQVAEFPLEAEENLDEVMEYQLGNYFPGDLSLFAFFGQIIGRADQLKVMIVAVRKEFLGHAFTQIRVWNLRLGGLSLSTFALLNGLIKLNPHAFEKDKTVIFSFDPKGVEVLAINAGRLVSSHFIEVSEDDDVPITADLEQAFSEARLDPNEVDHFLFAGSEHPFIQDYLVEELGIPVEDWLDANELAVPAEGLVGFGAAATSINDKPSFDLNMLPENKRTRQKRLPLILATIALSIMGLVFVYSEATNYMALKDKETTLTTRHAQFLNRMNEISKARSELDGMKVELEQFTPFQQDSMLTTILTELTDNMPDDTYLTQLQIKKGNTLQIQGESSNPFEVQRILTKMTFLKNVKPANAITSRKSGDGQSKSRFIYKATLVLEGFREKV